MKVLIVRFSSIGDVVLTTPVVRCLKKQNPSVEIHYLTKKSFLPILKDNPYIDKLFTIEKSIKEIIDELKKENYHWVIDLHKNIRTLSLKKALGVPSKSFPKLNIEKWLLVNFKIDKMKNQHIVDRYFETVSHLGIKNDFNSCDFFIHSTEEINVKSEFELVPKSFVAIAVGAQFFTKRMPLSLIRKIISTIDAPILLLGGKMDNDFSNEIIKSLPNQNIINACGPYSIQQSASIVKQAKVILTNDTGLMHIASCFQIPTVSVWGNTVPSLGMYPYFPKNEDLFSIHEVEGLKCRPCSKIGYKECPKKHFNCMNLQNNAEIISKIKHFYSS